MLIGNILLKIFQPLNTVQQIIQLILVLPIWYLHQHQQQNYKMPGYSMGRATRNTYSTNKIQTPGVGSYQTNSWQKMSRIKSSPSTSIPKTKKFFNLMEKPADVVGPGSYNPEKPHVSLMATIKGKSTIQIKPSAPSPANYNVNNQSKYSNKKYSFGRSLRKFKTEQGPGPAQYNVNPNTGYSSVGGYFGKDEKGKLIDQKIPGPGSYHYQPVDTISKSYQEYSFNKEKKFITEQHEQKMKSKIPGPGTYSISDFKKAYKGGKFGISQRLSNFSKGSNLGPGSYNPSEQLTDKKNPQAIIGQQKRDSNYSTIVPGPGNYDVIKPQIFLKKDGNAVFSQGQRSFNIGPKTPGPGSYHAKPLYQSRAYSITARHSTQKFQKSPGPQSYHPDFNKVQKNNGCAIVGSEQKLKKTKSQVPGPGHYKLSCQKMSKTFYFNKAKNNEKMNQTVGPGQYKLKPFIGVYDGAPKGNNQILFV